ncbi:MAG TPA: S53 family peptidase [Solirubrobacteraceae bacterium]
MSLRARLAAAALATGVLAAAPAAAAPPVQPGQQGFPHRPVCGPPQAGQARCHAEVITEADGVTPRVTPAPNGYGPAQLQAAYKLPSTTAGAGQTIAIVDAYDLPTAQNDLDTYRSQYALPACGAGCFTKVNQRGGASPPAVDAGWGQEIALDLDMASAICPNCKILLVEADSASIADLGAAVDTAVELGATVISNSYGTREFSSETAYDLHFDHPGKAAITVSSGDSGYGVEWPAASPWVTAVGGTSLKTAENARGWSETAWGGAGSGCSAVESRQWWQSSTATGCARRAVADVAAVADPNTGVAVYDSTAYQGSAGWMVFGGTSVAAPVIAGVYALAGNATSVEYGSFPYSHTGGLFDVTSGANGHCAKRTAQLCTARTGWDGPTGLGTPNGVSAF